MTWTPDILARRLELTAGGRYTKDDRAGTQPLVDMQLATSFHSFNPAFIANYRWTDDLRTYAKVTTGYKAGGVFFNVSGVNPAFRPEKLTTYEIGLKSEWLDRRLSLNADVFYSRYRDMQQVIATAVFLDGAAFNVGRATIKGLDIELMARPADNLSFSLSYAYLDPKLNDVPVIAGTVYDGAAPGSASPYRVGDNIERLFTLPFASKSAFAVSGDYSFLRWDAGGLNAHLDYKWQSKFYTDLQEGPAVSGRDQFAAIGSYGIFNARLTLSQVLSNGQRVTFSLWGRNLSDHRHQQIQFTATDGAVPSTNIAKAASWSEPRTVGASAGFEF